MDEKRIIVVGLFVVVAVVFGVWLTMEPSHCGTDRPCSQPSNTIPSPPGVGVITNQPPEGGKDPVIVIPKK